MANIVNHADALSVYGTTVYASAARTATPDTQEYELGGDTDELALVVDVTNVTATGTLTVKIEGVDRISGKTFPMAATPSITANGTSTLRVGASLPGTIGTPDGTVDRSVNTLVPPVIRVTATHGNGVSLTYSVGLHCS